MTQHSEAPGSLVLSVDLPTRDGTCKPGDHVATQNMLALLSKHRIKATWAADNFGDAAVDKIRAAREGHEIAFLGSQWASPEHDAKQVAQNLLSKLNMADQVGLSIRTMALGHHDVSDHLRLLAKHQVSMVRGRLDQTKRSPDAHPEVLRYGIWIAPISFALTRSDRWAIRRPVASAHRTLKAIASDGGAMHLAVDLSQFGSSQSDWGSLDRLLADAARCRDETGGIEFLSVQQFGLRYRCRNHSSPGSRSILHAA